MLSFPRVPSSTPVFYFKLAAGVRERGGELGKVIVTERERDSFKSWGQECSSASQGHRYFMTFTFLHDKLMPRIERVALEKKKSLTTVPFSPTPAYRVCSMLTFTSHCSIYVANLRVTLSDAFLLLANAGKSNGLKCKLLFRISSFHIFVFYKVLFNLMLIYRGLFLLRSLLRRRQQRKPPQPLNSSAHSLIIRCHPSLPSSPAPQTLFFI